MKAFSIFILLILFNIGSISYSQSIKNTLPTIYTILHNKEDVDFLVKYPNHEKLELKLELYQNNSITKWINSKSPVKIKLELKNLGTTELNKIIVHLFDDEGKKNPLIEFKIDKIAVGGIFVKEIEYQTTNIEGVQKFVAYMSGYNTEITKNSFYFPINTDEYHKPEILLNLIAIDDKTPVINNYNKTYDVNSKIEPGEKVHLKFSYINKSPIDLNDINFLLKPIYEDFNCSPIQMKVNNWKANESKVLIYELTPPMYLTPNNEIPFNCFLYQEKNGKKEIIDSQYIVLQFYKDVPSNYDKTTLQNSTIDKLIFSEKTRNIENFIEYSVELRNLKWNEQGTLELKLINQNTTYLRVKIDNLSHKGSKTLRFNDITENGFYNLSSTIKISKNYESLNFLQIGILPYVSAANRFDASNSIFSLRYSRLKKHGFYLELGSAPSINKYNYTYKTGYGMTDYDNYNNYYVFKPDSKINSTEIGGGYLLRIAKSIALNVGASYYRYKFLQNITEYKYSDNSYSKTALVKIESKDENKIVPKLGFTYWHGIFSCGINVGLYSNISSQFLIGCKF